MATVTTFGGEQKAQAVPQAELLCPLVTATVNYNTGFSSELVRPFTEAIETSNNILLGTEAGDGTVTCLDGRLPVPALRVTGGHGTLTGTKVGNCENVDVQKSTARIVWTHRQPDGTDVVVGKSTITYAASGPIEDTVITSGFVSGGDTFLDDKIVNNSINDGNTDATAKACATTAGVKTQTGKAQFTLEKY
ncbi:hypothetical protein [Streptomyces noursei]|uniref:hypothetical protein n=1 Tax=Streptomyces noursei TaxID=1971 RepID=UPI001671D8B0|nr:hypothetical protein [Streptomyces noursei]MCZ1014694.1 hypothetical protein [Streptomyces noursei]